MTTLWLNFHLPYACRHSGACCSSGWPIPVEVERVIPLRSLAARTDEGWLVPATNAPPDVAGTLALGADGHCVFHGAAGCGVHPARPASCEHFPYVCLIDARGVHVALSHYCPTAAALLFAHTDPIAIVDGPSPVAGRSLPEGLDARESLPPLESPTRLMSVDALARWEREAVTMPWHPAAVPTMVRTRELFEAARRAVPAPLDWPSAPGDLDRILAQQVDPAWAGFLPVLQRYRAAKMFASWALYLGDGIPAAERLVDQALAVLRVEAARQCEMAGGPLDAAKLKEAIRQTDLLLIHYADGRVLSSGAW